MSRQLEQKQEERQQRRIATLEKALEFGLAGAIGAQGGELLGFAIRYEPMSCLMTVKAEIDGIRSVAFVGSDTMINCILKADLDANNHRLRWRADQYHEK